MGGESDDEDEEDDDDEKKSKGSQAPSQATQGKGQGKGKGPSKRDAFDWEVHHMPKIAQREVTQVKVDREKLVEMKQKAMEKAEAGMRPDPADFNRKWRLNLAVTGIESWLDETIDVFLSISIADTGAKVEGELKKIKTKYSFTKKYRVTPAAPCMFPSEEQIYNKPFEFTYKGLSDQEVVMDVWSVASANFNQMVGTATVTFFYMATNSIYQVIPLYGDGGKAYIGNIFIKAVMSELFEFKIIAANWYYKLRPDKAMQSFGSKKMRIGVPDEPNGNETKFTTDEAFGPKYHWPLAGEFVYNGTDLSLSMEAISVEILADGQTQGKATVTMAAALEYPVAVGVVKMICENKEDYVQGKIAGSILVSKRSVLLEEGQLDEESSIPPPTQPPETLITFFLSPKMQYLVVELMSGDGLPIADTDVGSSHPIGRVKYDGVVMQSDVVESTLSPVWNRTFYIPVRVVDESIRSDEKHYQNLLPAEMQSKGYLEVEVWHHENVPTEFLGTCRVDLQRTRYAPLKDRAICDKVAEDAKGSSAEGDHGKDDVVIGIDPQLAKKHPCRVLEVRREALVGSKLQSSLQPCVSFDAYFVPDFPSDFKFPAQSEQDDNAAGAGAKNEKEKRFKPSFDKWEKHWKEFNSTYCAWFPDSTDRRWPFKFKDTSGHELPLVSLILPCALPASLEQPQALLHWIRCIEFEVPPRQRVAGEIEFWSQPDAVLAVRKGSVQDHAVVLCCALMGLRRDAFVCKGTVQGGREHAWVLTREDGGVVTFWETTTGCKHHLPDRWSGDAQHKDETKGNIEAMWQQRKLNKKWKDSTSERKGFSRPKHLQFMDDLMRTSIAPWESLLAKEMAVAVPYETIEVVFNGEQLYGNLGNAEPSCIYFNMEDDAKSWMPMILEEQRVHVAETRGDVLPVGLAISEYVCEKMENDMKLELMECIRMVRQRSGHETNFADDDLMVETMVKFLDCLEKEARLDADWCHDPEGAPKRPWSIPSAYNAQGYVEACKEAWKEHWERKAAVEEEKLYLSVKENHTLSGVPVHFSSADMKTIRYNIMKCEPLKEYLDIKMDEVLYFVVVKVFPMAGSVSSTWVFIGAEIPMAVPDIIAISEQLEKERAEQEALEEEANVSGKSGSGSEDEGEAEKKDDEDEDEDD